MNYTIQEDGLHVTVSRAERTALRRMRKQKLDFQSDATLADELEPLTGGDLEWVTPEDIGALTTAPILGISKTEAEEIKTGWKWEHIFWFPDYAVRSPLDDLADYGELVFAEAK